MSKIFNYDSPLIRTLSKIADLLVLNLMALLCSIPLVTVGAVTAAMYDTVERLQKDEAHLYGRFLKSFGSNFKQSLAMWLIMAVFGAFIVFSLYYYYITPMSNRNILLIVTVVAFALWAMILSWAFPLQAKFSNPVGVTLRNAVFCMLAYLPRSVVMAAINLIPWVMLAFIPLRFIQFAPIWMTLYFSVAAFANLKLLKKPMTVLMEQAEETQPV